MNLFRNQHLKAPTPDLIKSKILLVKTRGYIFGLQGSDSDNELSKEQPLITALILFSVNCTL